MAVSEALVFHKHILFLNAFCSIKDIPPFGSYFVISAVNLDNTVIFCDPEKYSFQASYGITLTIQSHFSTTLREKALENGGKGRKPWKLAVFSFPKMLSPLPQTSDMTEILLKWYKIPFNQSINQSINHQSINQSAIPKTNSRSFITFINCHLQSVFNLDMSEVLSFGKGITVCGLFYDIIV